MFLDLHMLLFFLLHGTTRKDARGKVATQSICSSLARKRTVFYVKSGTYVNINTRKILLAYAILCVHDISHFSIGHTSQYNQLK